MWHVVFFACSIIALIGSALVLLQWTLIVREVVSTHGRSQKHRPEWLREWRDNLGVAALCICGYAPALYLSFRFRYHLTVVVWLAIPAGLAVMMAVFIMFAKSIETGAIFYRGALRPWWREVKRRAALDD
jgi:hypothetical protein